MKLEKQLEKELKTRFNEYVKNIKNFKSVDEVLGWWYYRGLLTKKQLEKINQLTLKEVKSLLINRLKKRQEKIRQKELKKINAILEQENIRWGKCSIEWTKNRTWGNCPKGEYCNGFKYRRLQI